MAALSYAASWNSIFAHILYITGVSCCNDVHISRDDVERNTVSQSRDSKDLDFQLFLI